MTLLYTCTRLRGLRRSPGCAILVLDSVGATDGALISFELLVVGMCDQSGAVVGGSKRVGVKGCSTAGGGRVCFFSSRARGGTVTELGTSARRPFTESVAHPLPLPLLLLVSQPPLSPSPQPLWPQPLSPQPLSPEPPQPPSVTLLLPSFLVSLLPLG